MNLREYQNDKLNYTPKKSYKQKEASNGDLISSIAN